MWNFIISPPSLKRPAGSYRAVLSQQQLPVNICIAEIVIYDRIIVHILAKPLPFGFGHDLFLAVSVFRSSTLRPPFYPQTGGYKRTGASTGVVSTRAEEYGEYRSAGDRSTGAQEHRSTGGRTGGRGYRGTGAQEPRSTGGSTAVREGIQEYGREYRSTGGSTGVRKGAQEYRREYGREYMRTGGRTVVHEYRREHRNTGGREYRRDHRNTGGREYRRDHRNTGGRECIVIVIVIVASLMKSAWWLAAGMPQAAVQSAAVPAELDPREAMRSVS